jgi:hypothetical protein
LSLDEASASGQWIRAPAHPVASVLRAGEAIVARKWNAVAALRCALVIAGAGVAVVAWATLRTAVTRREVDVGPGRVGDIGNSVGHVGLDTVGDVRLDAVGHVGLDTVGDVGLDAVRDVGTGLDRIGSTVVGVLLECRLKAANISETQDDRNHTEVLHGRYSSFP